MKYWVLLLAALLTGCSAGSVTRMVVEDASGIDIGNSGSYCAQLKMQCRANPGQVAGENGRYREWENRDGSIGCACDNQ